MSRQHSPTIPYTAWRVWTNPTETDVGLEQVVIKMAICQTLAGQGAVPMTVIKIALDPLYIQSFGFDC